MTSTDSMPGLPAAPATALQARGVPPKDGKAAKRESDDGFSSAMRKVSADQDKPASPSDRTTHQPEMGPPLRRRLEAARLQADGTADAAQATLEEAAAALLAAKSEGPAEGQPLADGEDDAALSESAEPTQGQGMAAHGSGGAEALALLLGHVQRGGPQREAETKASLRRVELNADAGAPAEAPVPATPIKIVSVKVETHFARNSMDALAAEIAQRLSGLGGMGSGPQAKGLDSGPTKLSSAGSIQEVAARDELAEQPHSTGRGMRNAVRETGQRGNDDSGKGAWHAGEDADAVRSLEPSASASVAADPVSQASSTGTPAQQLGGRLVGVAQEMQSAEAASRSGAAGSPGSAQPGPIRVLSIDLHPAELGSVTVRMSLAGEALEVQIEAERPDTARRLQNDVGALSDMLRSAGVQVDGVTVRAAPADAVSGGGSQLFQDQQSQSQSGGAQPDARASGGNDREQEAQTPAERRQDQGAGGEHRLRPVAGNGLYV